MGSTSLTCASVCDSYRCLSMNIQRFHLMLFRTSLDSVTMEGGSLMIGIGNAIYVCPAFGGYLQFSIQYTQICLFYTTFTYINIVLLLFLTDVAWSAFYPTHIPRTSFLIPNTNFRPVATITLRPRVTTRPMWSSYVTCQWHKHRKCLGWTITLISLKSYKKQNWYIRTHQGYIVP